MSRFDVRSVRARATLASALLAPLVVLWSGPSLAESACLKGAALNKLCVDIASVPGDSVQPSGLAGTPTYVKYTASIRNLVAATSRSVSLTLTLSPTPPSPISVSPDAGATCSVSGATVSCLVDKLEGIDALQVVAVAEAPTYPTSVTEMVNTVVIGWNGNTATATRTVAVSDTAGDSYVPANRQVTLATSGNDDVTAESPVYGEITLPPQPFPYQATITIVSDAPANANCVGGIYLSATYGGPYVCRDTDTPRRALKIDVGSAVFTAANPILFKHKWDTTIVPALQLPPSPIAPTGLPAFAMFSAELDQAGLPTADYAPLATLCDTDTAAPCLTGVQQLANGDWQVDAKRTNDGTETGTGAFGQEIVRAFTPLAPLYAMLDLLVPPAQAQIQLPTKPGIGFAM